MKQKPRMINPKLKPFVKFELDKMESDGLIFSIKHTKWIQIFWF